jgi:hypothetical protein
MLDGFTVEVVYTAAKRVRADIPDSFRDVCEVVEATMHALSDRSQRDDFDRTRHAIAERATDPSYDGELYLWAASALHAVADLLLYMATGSIDKPETPPALLHSVGQVDPAPEGGVERLRLLLEAQPWKAPGE